MTKLLYLGDTYLFQSPATIVAVCKDESDRTTIILDQTIFYPQGGGQPFDLGKIVLENAEFNVTAVRLDENGIVHHFGEFAKGSFEPGDIVTLHIDEARRVHHAKLHSAGHLIDCAITQLNLPLTPSKGYHFAEGPYVEYAGEIEQTPEMVAAIQDNVNELVANNISIMVNELSAEEAKKQGIVAPPGKSVRLVLFEGFEPCGCGGTHVRNAAKIGKIIIRKIKSKKGNVRISYEVV